MNALVLGGMSPRHHEWVRQVAKALESRFETVQFLDYRHWEQTGAEMSVEHELTQAAELARDLDEYVVVAKSIGTVVATLGTARGLLAPNRNVFMGFPLKAVEVDLPEVADALPHLPPTVFLHNEYDPLGTAEAVRAYVTAHAPKTYDFRVLPGNTHDYIDFDLITTLAAQHFVSS